VEFTLLLSASSSGEHGARQCMSMCTVVMVSARGWWWGDGTHYTHRWCHHQED